MQDTDILLAVLPFQLKEDQEIHKQGIFLERKKADEISNRLGGEVRD
jgi:hypothetical protein